MAANLFPSKKLTPQQVGLLSAAVPSPFGDALGLLADGIGYAKDPKSLTPGTGLLSLAGLLPGVPRGGAKISDWTRGNGNPDYLLHIADKANVDSILKEGLKPGKADDYVYLWKEGLDAESDKIMREARMSRLGLDWDSAGAVEDGYFAVDKKALGSRLQVDPYTGEARVQGKIPPWALRLLED